MNRAFFLLIITILSVPALSQNINDKVKIRRTSYGVPHILAEDLESVAFGLAYAELEDRGEKVILPLIRSMGIISKYTGTENIESDFYSKLVLEYTRETYNLLDQDTRDILDGFASGVNYYLEKHPKQFPEWYYQNFTGPIVAAASNRGSRPRNTAARDFLKNLEEKKRLALENDDVGSNVWAFAPERTKSGNAILMRNPHLSWEAGYYEAHITVPGKINFYGDFRIGGMFAIICGFNNNLGWSTTNNHPDLEEVYALKVDPDKPDHYLLDGARSPIKRKTVQVEFKNGNGTGFVNKEWLYTQYGPVIDRALGYIYIVKTADWNNFRRGEQLVAMMKSSNLQEWKSAIQKRNISSSNYTYADVDGNIFYIWNASTPNLPHAFKGDTIAIEANSSDDIWAQYQDFDRIPQLQNPKGGYLQNSNDPFYYTNLNEPISKEGQPENFPEPRLRLRSQHSLSLIDNDNKYSLKEIVDMKYSMKVLAADRLKNDLINAINERPDIKNGSEIVKYLNNWDNTSSAESQGSVLFNAWFFNYRSLVGSDSIYRIPWNWDKPTSTPFGLNNPDEAIKALEMAIDTLINNYGDYKLAWGELYRVRRGNVDVPVGGGSGTIGNFRVIYFGQKEEDGKRRVIGGDGWVFAVEFGKRIKAYSVLAYGQSNNPENPHFDDQAKLFAENKMKKVSFSEKEIKKDMVKSYKPGEEE